MFRLTTGEIRAPRRVSLPVVHPRDITAFLADLADLADELVTDVAPPVHITQRALEQLRHRTGAAEAVAWVICDGRARRALYAGSGTSNTPAQTVELTDPAKALDRLRHVGRVLRARGEVPGLEALVPDAARSFFMTAIAYPSAVVGALVLGWTDTLPPSNHGALAYVRIIAGLLLRATLHNGDHLFHELADTLPAAICVVTREGRLVYGNQRWIAGTGRGIHSGLHALEWTDAFHADDRTRAASAFRAAASRCERFDLEVRLNSNDRPDTWWACIGVPQRAADGRAERFVVLCPDISAQRQAESRLTQIASKLVGAQERERSRIARELHDDLGQQLALLASKLDVTGRNGRLSRQQLRIGIAEAQRVLQDLAVSIHNLSYELHPAKLKLIGLELTLETLCRNVSSERDVRIHFDRHDIPLDVPEDSALCVFRVTQEALQNAVKHSKARSIDVRLTGMPSRLMLQVIDDGAGFDCADSQSAGLGLLTMRERVELTGGELTIHTSRGRGTIIEAIVPLTHTGSSAG